MKISTFNSLSNAKSTEKKKREISRTTRERKKREEDSVGSNIRMVLFVQKPRPRFYVKVQTGRGEQPLGVWRIGVVYHVYNRVVTGSMIPNENKLFSTPVDSYYEHRCITLKENLSI